MLSFVESLRLWARDRPDEIAVATPQVEFTAKELWETSAQILGWLDQTGIARTEVLAVNVPAPLQPAFIIALHSRSGPGAIATGPIQVGPGSPISCLVSWNEPTVAVPAENLVRFDETALAQMAKIDPETVKISSPASQDPIWFLFSSGSTGSPKAILLSAGAVEARLTARRRRIAKQGYLALQQGVFSSALPAFHTSLLKRRPYLIAGDLDETIPLIEKFDVEIIEGSPFQLDQFLAEARRRGLRFPRLKEFISPGAPISKMLAQSLCDWFGADIYDSYGSGEAGFVGSKKVAGEAPIAPGAVLDENIEVQIVSEVMDALTEGEIGIIRIRTPAMAIGYLTEERSEPMTGFQDGWFYPGDLGLLQDGRLVVIGRTDDLLNVAGRKIAADRVEEVVKKQIGASEVVACAVNDRLDIRQLAIAYVGPAISDPSRIASELGEQLDGIKPSLLMRMAAIPRNENGKPRLDEVRRLLQEQLSREKPLL